MIKIENLVYKEDAEVKCFASENFNFIYSKIDNTSCSWGKTKDETPEYNPISPETITIKVDSNFLFNRDLILKLISLDYKKGECISCITSVIIEGKQNDVFNNDEIKKLINYVDTFKIVCFLKIDLENEFTLKDVFKIKYLGCKNVILNISNINERSIKNSINILCENSILVNCNFNINSKNVDNLINLFLDNYQLDVLSTINFVKPMIKKDVLNKLTNVVKEKQLVNIIVNKEVKSRKKYEIKNKINESGLFSCVVDFINNKIYCENFNENFVNIVDVKTIYDYWNSDSFNEVRQQLIKGF